MNTVFDLNSPGMRAARVVADLHQKGPKVKRLTSEQKRIARHLARNDKTIEEIRLALGVNMSWGVLRVRLRECNIKTKRSR